MINQANAEQIAIAKQLVKQKEAEYDALPEIMTVGEALHAIRLINSIEYLKEQIERGEK